MSLQNSARRSKIKRRTRRDRRPAIHVERGDPRRRYSSPRSVSASSSGGDGSETATPGGTASPRSASPLWRLPRGTRAGLDFCVVGAGLVTAASSSCAILLSSSSIRATLPSAARVRLLRSVATVRSSFSTWACSSPLPGFGAEGAAGGLRGAVAGLAMAAGWRVFRTAGIATGVADFDPGERPRRRVPGAEAFVGLVVLVVLAIALPTPCWS